MTSKRFKIEKTIYEILGIKLFRKLVFFLERITHKNGGRNINYHISAYNSSAMDEFVKYLFFNGSIHVRNLFILGAAVAVKWAVFDAFSYWDLIFVLLWIKDLYCVMLQRYNYLRIKLRSDSLEPLIDRKNKRQLAEIKIKLCEVYADDSSKKADIEFIDRIIAAMNGDENFTISEKELESLERINLIFNLTD